MRRILRFFVRVSAFLRKEIVEILRQPRLLLTLVLGPFLILLLFGLGYTAEAIPLRTLFVVPPDSELGPYIEQNADTIVQQLVFEGIVDNEEIARARLRAGQVDIVIVAPANVTETVRSSEQATFLFYHDEINPLQAQYAQAFTDLFISEINRRTLRSLTEQGQVEAGDVQPDVSAARESAAAMRQAMEADDEAGAETQMERLDQEVSGLELALLAGGLIIASAPGAEQDADSPAAILQELRQDTDALEEAQGDPEREEEARERLVEVENDLGRLETALQEFRTINSAVLVSPFRGELHNVYDVNFDIVDFYTPPVIVLLLQHLAITFGALSIVREQRMGIMELFQAAPLSAFEVLLGKYLSYLIFTALLTAVLTLLLVFGLGVPMRGAWEHYALILFALLFASLGIGFVLSLLSQTNSQAVQYSMLALLVSVFFSGFFLDLALLRPAVRIVSWSIPATYGIEMLQNVMLRGQILNSLWIGVLAAMGVGLFLVAWLLLRRSMHRG
jgi:ABC-2 type transport system permease protein